MQIKCFGVGMKDFAIKHVLTLVEDIKKTIVSVLNLIEADNTLTDERRYEIELIMNELLVNSFKHANPSALEPVVLTADVSNGKLSIRVTDSGEGFEYNKALTPEDSQTLLKESGRGLTLVKAFSQSIKYNLIGNSVEVEIAL